jgi:rfaE bifunctional protein nucleotidyltransferase chain/domain
MSLVRSDRVARRPAARRLDFERKIVATADASLAAARLPPAGIHQWCLRPAASRTRHLLAQARALGASLIVAVNDDASVRRLGKGDDRPINACADRMAVLAALGMVDLVTSFGDDTPLALILAARPEVLVKGGDWPLDRIVGADAVRGWGGQVHSIAFEHERSTTSMLEKIRQPR